MLYSQVTTRFLSLRKLRFSHSFHLTQVRFLEHVRLWMVSTYANHSGRRPAVPAPALSPRERERVHEQ
jgi:hypothetical protein